MKKLSIFTLAAITIINASNLYAEKTENSQSVYRENTEWSDIWITECKKNDKPHVLLVGDSITKAYYSGVGKGLKGKAYVGRFATSLCLGDPAYVPMLKSILLHVKYDVIHFNNGLHGLDYSEEQYEKGYTEAVATIRELQPEAKIIITLCTPLKKGSNKDHFNPRIDERNRIATEIAKSIGADIDDLNTPMLNHPEYYRDPYHFHGSAVNIQSQQVANSIKKALNIQEQNITGEI